MPKEMSVEQFHEINDNNIKQKIQQVSVAPILASALKPFIEINNVAVNTLILEKLFNEPAEVVSHKLTQIMSSTTANHAKKNIQSEELLSQCANELIGYYQKALSDIEP